ncbi:flagellar biosynthetic protein FliO [Devosia aquimaris]|uniref:flagellar biosynthetic protein FliO n=1 Tax=Devosia aquimaris TaxID=2866214 RepID=UPI001CD0C52B|nr:flagellar biosynthetic protein FliO [Devosia sp. CJK-A8-3]
MQFITSLIGGTGNSWITALFALGIVLVLIVLGVWLLKLLFNASAKVSRGRNRRLAIVDSMSIDPKRQLLIIRRDDVEHLILTGGPQDVVIETGIAIAEQPAAQPTRRPIPSVPGRKPASGAKPVPPQPAPAPATAPRAEPAPTPPLVTAAPGTVLAELQKQGLPTNQRAHVSLRHTGLLRPVSEMELPVSPENDADTARQPLDSAKEDGAQREIEGTDFVPGHTDANRS